MRIEDLIAFIVERHNIWRKKNREEPKPWTTDPILQQYRFCNVYRERDTETIWIAENWRRPHSADPDLWFAMVVARLVNWHETLEEIGYPVPWKPDHFVNVMERRKERGQKMFTGAYMVRAEPKYDGPKSQYLAEQVLTPMWEDRESLRRIVHGTLAQAHRTLMTYRDMGSFMAGQIIADLKYVEPLRSAKDWQVWAASGPGSKRGLNRVLDRDVDDTWRESDWLQNLQILHDKIRPRIRKIMPPIHAQDLQNCLCEWDKYERVRLGEGKPRGKYRGLPV